MRRHKAWDQEAGLLLQTEDANGLQDAQGTHRIRVGRVLGRVERHRDMALGRQVVNLVGLHVLDDADQARAVGHVAVVQHKPTVVDVGILVEVVDAVGIEQRRPPLHPMHLVTLVEEKLGEVRPVLTGHTGDQSSLAHIFSC